MTILNRPSDGLFNILIVLFRAIVSVGPMDKDRLLSLCAAGDGSDTTQLKNTLRRWTQLGFFCEQEGKIGLEKEVREASKNSTDVDTTHIPSVLRRIVFREDNNEGFWDQEKTLCADFTRGLSFLMAQDIYEVNLSSNATVQEFEQQQTAGNDKRILQNDTRWSGLRAWARYLGFFWEGESIMVDPTRAVREDLLLVFGQDEVLSAAEFLARLAEIIPVLDGGRYRTEVESILDPTHWHRPMREDMISTSLSRALWRLENAGVLGFETRADAGDICTLQRSGKREWARFTHIHYKGSNL